MAPQNSSADGLTMTFLGCGTMGIAILGGILSSLSSTTSAEDSGPDTPSRLPTKFIACTKRASSADKISAALGDSSNVEFLSGRNVEAVSRADVVLLGCKPYMFKDILAEPGMREALSGKLLISILAGVTASQFHTTLYSDAAPKEKGEEPCTVVRAMPSTAALIRKSMTVVETSDPPLPEEVTNLVTWIFKRVGEVAHLPAHNMDASTALCGSGPAFFALMLEAAADGAVAMGLPRAEAQRMAAQTMAGAAGLVLNGEHPALLRDKVSTPGGCTIGGLMVLEEGGVRGSVARAIREATVVASQLGQGVKNVNGTRF